MAVMNGKLAKRWVVRGSVQGVGFRMFVQRKAASLGISGWVRNLDDGNVEVYAAGTASQLDDLASALHQGPRLAEVRSVDEREESVQRLSGFAVH